MKRDTYTYSVRLKQRNQLNIFRRLIHPRMDALLVFNHQQTEELSVRWRTVDFIEMPIAVDILDGV